MPHIIVLFIPSKADIPDLELYTALSSRKEGRKKERQDINVIYTNQFIQFTEMYRCTA